MAMWLGALAGAVLDPVVGWMLIVLAMLGAVTGGRRVLMLIGILGVGVVSGAGAVHRRAETLEAGLPAGRGVLVGVATTDSLRYGSSFRFVLRPTGWSTVWGERPWIGPPIAVIGDESGVVAGDVVSVSGMVRAQPDLIRGDPVAGRITARSVTVQRGSASPVMAAGNAVRRRVQAQIGRLGVSAEAALLRGFLIGDIDDLPESDTESLRRAGLTHYVAVSGSNVALVLGAWWLVLGPTGAGSRTRAVTGLVVLAVFVVATRWEPSVIRAATMAALMLAGRALGVAVDAWLGLGGAVALLLALSGDLAYDAGFQLSVLATAGVLLGARLWADRSPRPVWGLLGATLSAQVAVAPILLLHFGTVPLLAPIANLIAAPLVTIATGLAGAGVIVGWDLPLRLAGIVARLILEVARTVGEWPQLGPVAVAGLGLLVAAARWIRMRGAVAAVVGAVVLVAMIPPPPPATPTVVFVDVGEGNATLLRDPSGAVVLVDGGRDPEVLRAALRRYGVRRIDLLVGSHGDADHVGGFAGLLSFVTVGRIWVPDFATTGEILDEVIGDAESRRVAVDRVARGARAEVGEFAIDVLGPDRRYETDNDGSVVLMVESGDHTVLLPGDIEAIAQRSIGPQHPDILVLPHHGAATTDPAWLAATVGPMAVISVGPNTYGHPAPEILEILEASETQVLSTWEEGDISIALR
jgi:competence protein ComEC